jgi:hypothetical protein
MRNQFFSVHSLNGDKVEDYISAVYALATNIGITLIEDSENDTVIAKLPDQEITVMQGMHDLNGNYMPRWCYAEQCNLPEYLVHYAMVHQTAGKKKIRLAKRIFDKMYPTYFDKWMYDFKKGATPNGWVSIV